MKVIGAFVLAAALMVCSGCASLTGLVTGAFTGAVDLPAETYRQNRLAFEQNPMLFGLDVFVVAPCGIVGGPVVGLVKGASLDVEWVCGKIGYGRGLRYVQGGQHLAALDDLLAQPQADEYGQSAQSGQPGSVERRREASRLRSTPDDRLKQLQVVRVFRGQFLGVPLDAEDEAVVLRLDSLDNPVAAPR